LVEVDKKPAVTLQAKNIWIKGNRSIFHIRFYDRNKKQAAGVSLYFFDQQFNLTRRVDAQSGKFQDDVWIFKEVMEQVLDENQDAYLVSYSPERKLAVDFLPEDLSRVAKKSEEMNIKELFDYIQDVEAEGYDATLYRVDFYSKMVFPFVCLIVCLVGAGIALRRKRRENLSVSIAFGLGIAFLYWIFHSFCISLGYGGILPAALAPWVTVIVFSCIAGLTLLHAD
jgi:lipopolysaccharide export system permease protein